MPRIPRFSCGFLTAVLPALLLFQASCTEIISEQGKRRLRSAAELMEQNSYTAAEQELDQFIKAQPTIFGAGEAYYLRGLCRIHTDRVDPAEKDFRTALNMAHLPVLRRYARLSLANLAFERRDYATAAEFYADYLDDLPRRPPFHLAYYRYGLALQAVGQWPQADIQFSRVSHLFPEAQVTPSARQLFGKTHYAIELGRFSSFDQADRQRRQLTDLSEKIYWRIDWDKDHWSHINLYGKYLDFQQARQALDQFTPRLPQARIVTAAASGAQDD